MVLRQERRAGQAPREQHDLLREGFTLPEPRDQSRRGYEFQYDQVRLVVGAASFGNVQVGLYGLWHQTNARQVGPGTSGDLGLVVSNDGIHFREPVKGHAFISRHDSPATPAPGKDCNTMLCQYNGILNVCDETRIYHGRWRNVGLSEDYYAEVALATLPRDRWGVLGLFPDQSEGWVWSAPITMPEGSRTITLNADHPELMSVELSNERFGLLPEYSLENSGALQAGEGLEAPVRWPAGDLSRLTGKSLRFRIHLKKGRPPRAQALRGLSQVG